MVQKALKLLSKKDSSIVIALLEEQDDTLAAARSFEELARHLYWQAKDIPNMILIARAGIQFGLTQAATGTTDSAIAYQLRSVAKAIAYNLASFTWPGWGEPDMPMGTTDIRIGLDAARTNLRLAYELGKGNLPLCRAHWMLAAQEMATHDFAAAINNFDQAAIYAQKASEKPEVLLCQGFAHLSANLLQESNEVQEKLASVKAKLAPLEHGSDFIAQIETAAHVFQSNSFG